MSTQTIYTNKDAFTKQSDPNYNRGLTNTIFVTENSPISHYGYIGFDITSAPASSQVTNVLIYYYHYTYPGTPTAYFRRTTSSWVETTITWNNSPSITDTNMATGSFPGSGNWGSCNVTNLYKDAKNAGNDFSVQIRQSSSSTVALAARELGSTYDAYIVITYGAVTDYYVKTTGNDSLGGDSWTNAWKTINKAAITAIDGTTVHIGFGTYDAEPATNKIAPQNIGSLGIYYLPETATTGGGTGTVSIEQN